MNDIESEVLAVSAAWDEALVANDADAVASFMADDWVFVGPDGIATKAEIVGFIADGRLVHHTMKSIGKPRIAVHGDTVLLTARRASTGRWESTEYTADEWTTEVFVRQGGRWVCVLSHKAEVRDETD